MKQRLLGGTVALALLIQGCQATTPKSAAQPGKVQLQSRRELTDEQVGLALVELLRSDRRHGQNAQLTAAIVRHQLRRATALFRADEREAALRAVRGSIFLVQAGEASSAMWEGASHALALAAEEASRLGNEGQARALYALLKQAQPSKAQVESANEHLTAMDQFAARPATDRALEKAGDEQRVAVERSNYEPSQENLELASRKVADWIRVALASDVLDRWGEAAFDRQEAIEAYRARRYGALTLVSAHLRHGDPMGALEWLEKSDLGRLTPAELRHRLELAGQDDDVNAWGQLYQFFQSETESNRAESSIGDDLAQATAFGLAVELYRSHPESLIATGPIALMLPDFQMGDAVPALLLGALGTHPGREELSWATSLLMRAMLIHGDAGDLATARRVFQQGATILKLAELSVAKGEMIRPHPARVYRVMATLESRAADLNRSREALNKALQLEPSALGFVELARVERQLGQLPMAFKWLDQASTQAKASVDWLGATDAHTARFELLTERGDAPAAATALRSALDAATEAREKATRPVELSQAERRYARVLELYGRYDGAERASQRALQAARTDAQQLSLTILDSARRALVHNDLQAGRLALKDAQEYGLSGEDCTYVALWVRILELQRGMSSDGTVEELLSKLGEIAYWPGKLKGLLLGQVSEAELTAAAHRQTDQVELAFYRAMLLPPSKGKTADATRTAIAAAAASHAVGLIEVAAAQDLLRVERFPVPPTFPTNVTIP